MGDDRLSRQGEMDLFAAIVSQLDDPELIRFKRLFAVLGVLLFTVSAVVITAVVGLGAAGVLAFSSTFVPGLIIAERLNRRRFALGPGKRR
jgi:hypothetical protein